MCTQRCKSVFSKRIITFTSLLVVVMSIVLCRYKVYGNIYLLSQTVLSRDAIVELH